MRRSFRARNRSGSDTAVTLGDRAAAAHQASWRQTHARWGRGWLEAHRGFVVSFSELAVPSFNGASVYGDFDAAELLEGLTKVELSGMPYSLQCRPGVLGAVSALADDLGMLPQVGAPLMVCETPPVEPAIPGLRIRELAPEENHIHAAILAEAFDAPLDVSIELMPEQMLSPANVWTLVGDLDGRPVTTAYLDVHGDVANVHNVGTRVDFRGRGLGAAITAATVRTGFAAGAGFAMLLSSQMAVGVYESVGFREVEHWSAWESGLVIG